MRVPLPYARMCAKPTGIAVCFRYCWNLDDYPLLNTLLPWFDRAVLAVMLPEGLAVYACHDAPALVCKVLPFSKRFHPWDSLKSDTWRQYRVLKLRILPTECEKIHAQCEACAQAGLQYSLTDLSLSLVPFRNPPDLPINQVKSVRNVQAVILILRECLQLTENPLAVVLREVNSRTTNPTDLHQILTPYTFVYYPTIHKKIF
jgi:hypothetical protein